jgi:hypothetical protein
VIKHEKQRLLLNRGIGKKYHYMSLTEYPDPIAVEIMDWLSADATTHLKDGKGVTFFSKKQEGYDSAVLTARALILSGYNKLRQIDFNFCVEDEFLGEISQEKPPLLIVNFYPDASFVSPEKYKRLETILNHYLDNCIPLLLHIPADVEGPENEYGPLISPVFLDRIKKNSKTFSV